MQYLKKLNILILEKCMLSIDYISHTLHDFLTDDSGASLIEYVLIGSLIAVVGTLFLLAFSKSN